MATTTLYCSEGSRYNYQTSAWQSSFDNELFIGYIPQVSGYTAGINIYTFGQLPSGITISSAIVYFSGYSDSPVNSTYYVRAANTYKTWDISAPSGASSYNVSLPTTYPPSGSYAGLDITTQINTYAVQGQNLYLYLYQNSSSFDGYVPHNIVDSSYPYIVITYTPSYSVCGYPTLVSVDNQTPDLSSLVLLSWSGATNGTNNTITGYKIYRSTTSGGTYSALTGDTRDVTTSESSGSFSVTSPNTYGNSYFYKIKTTGSVTGYDSDLSTVYATVTSTLPTACIAPTTTSPSTATPEPNSAVTITWDAGTAGDNNAIIGYQLYRDATEGGAFTTLVGETDDTTLSSIVYSSPNENGVYYYRVKTKGSAGVSFYSPLSTVFALITSTKSDSSCGAPTTVSISDDKPEPLDSLTISWSGATAGTGNAITGYEVYEDSSESGTFSTLTGTVTTTETFGELSSVSAASAYGTTKYYRVKTIGTTEGGDSGFSSAVSYKTYLYANYGISIPSEAILPAAIQYIVVYYDATNVYKTLDNTVLDVVEKETVLPCSGVYNVSTDHRYLVTTYISEAYVNADKARALTESEQTFYLANGTTKTDVLVKQWTGSDWTTNVSTNVASWSQAAASEIVQTAYNITQKVSKGAIISEINQSAEEVSISANKITLEGIVTANENFKILADGSMEAVNGLFGGNLTAEATYCNNLLLNSGKEMTVGLWKIGSAGVYYPSGQGFNYLAFLYNGYNAYVTSQAPMYLGPDQSNPLYVSGNGVTFTITNNNYSAGFIQDYYISEGSQVLYQEICLVCNQAGDTYETAKGNLGTQTHRWDVLWVDTAHYNTHPSDSSILVKHDIVNLRDVGEIIDNVRTVEFKYNNDASDRTRFGLIYEELIKLLPELCRQDDKTGEFGIEYDDFIAVLLKQAQESRKKERELEDKVKSLEDRLERLEKLLIK